MGLGLKREELEKLVIDLYYNQNKTFPEVQKTVRKSLGDIRLILDKEGKLQLLNIESQLTSVIFLPHIRYRQIHFLI